MERLKEENQLKYKRLVLNTHKWVLSFPVHVPIDALVDEMKKIVEMEEKQDWKITHDPYNRTTQFIVVHTRNQFPETEDYLKKWAELPFFNQNLNNFVLLSAQYEQVQRLKSWDAIHKIPQE